MERYLLFDAGCAVCNQIAEAIEEAATGKLQALSIRDPQAREWLEQAYSAGWEHRPYLVTVEEYRVQVSSGTGMALRLGWLLGPRKAWRVWNLARQYGVSWPAFGDQVARPHNGVKTMNRHHVSNILYCVGSSLGIQSLSGFVRTQVETGHAREREYDRSRLQASTRSMLKRIIAHANETVPFYQALWKEKGVNISKITIAGDLPSLPLVAKADLQRNPRRALLSKESRKTSLRSTSGTTAAPRLVFRDETARIYWSTAVRRYLAEYEVPAGGTVLLTHSQPLTPIRYQAGANENWIRWVWVSVSDLIETLGLAARLNADAVLGSPQQLEAIAQLAYSTGDIRPPKVFVSFAERLDPASRRRIERATGANVFDMYCTTELSVPIAFECRGHTGLHTNSDYVIVEVVNSAGDPVGPGEQGEVVVTDLCNFVSPVIRYRLGDIATKTVSSTCSCGRALPLQILRIDGRVTDQVFLSNGRVMNALPLIDELQAATACPLTLIQETHDSFTLKCYYTAAKRSAVPRDRIEQIVRHYLGPETNLQICIDKLSATLHNESGKVRSFFSRIPKDENVVPVSTFTRSR